MSRTNLLIVFAICYFGIRCFDGYLYCERNFCPGDNLDDYIYEIKDTTGRSYIVGDDGTIPKDMYEERKLGKEQ